MDSHVARLTATYRALLAASIFFLALTLLTLLDFRRGFLFTAYPVRSLFYVFHPIHILMLAVGIAGMAACYRRLRDLEALGLSTARYTRMLTFIILALLVIDLFVYRGVPAARSLASGRINVDWLNAFGVREWWRPIAQATSYLLNVWHATMLGALIAGLQGIAARCSIRAAAAVLLVLFVRHGAIDGTTRSLH